MRSARSDDRCDSPICLVRACRQRRMRPPPGALVVQPFRDCTTDGRDARIGKNPGDRVRPRHTYLSLSRTLASRLDLFCRHVPSETNSRAPSQAACHAIARAPGSRAFNFLQPHKLSPFWRRCPAAPRVWIVARAGAPRRTHTLLSTRIEDASPFHARSARRFRAGMLIALMKNEVLEFFSNAFNKRGDHVVS